MRLLFCLVCLSLIDPLFGQGGMYLPDDLSRLFPDSLVSQETLKKWEQNLTSVGQLNDRCTASIISPNGLLISNYHCLSGLIQNPKHRIKGFIATQYQDEIPLPDLHFKLEIFRKDITAIILKGISPNTPEKERAAIINRNSLSLILEQNLPKDQQAFIRSHHEGGQFYLIIQKIFRDVRLVLLPSKLEADSNFFSRFGSIKNLNDFALLRIYTNKNQQALKYNFSNEPYLADTFISLRGKNLINRQHHSLLHAGYPGNTQFYLSSNHLNLEAIQRLQTELSVDTSALAIYQAIDSTAKEIPYLLADIQSKRKKIDLFLERQILQEKGREELQLMSKTNAKTYQNALQRLQQELVAKDNLINAKYLIDYTFVHDELFQQSKYLRAFIQMEKDRGIEAVQRRKSAIINFLKTREGKRSQLSKQLILAKSIERYFNTLKSQDLSPIAIEQIRAVNKDYQLLAEIFYEESLMNDIPKQIKIIEKDVEKWIKSLEKDIAYRFFDQILFSNKIKITQPYNQTQKKLQNLQRVLIQEKIAISSPPFPVAANGSLRLSPGNSVTEVKLPLFADKTQTWFYKINLHCSKGSSGGPVFDKYGNLISIHVSRIKESQLSDYFFDPTKDHSLSLSTARIKAYLDSQEDASWINREINWK